MKYLDKSATDAFLVSIWMLYDADLIGHIEFIEYLKELYRIVPKGSDDAEYIENCVYRLGGEIEESLDDFQSDQYDDAQIVVEYERNERLGAERDQEPVVLQFIVHGVDGMKKWEFHQTDADPWPSIPHGHWENKAHPKLNPYTGRAYSKNRDEDLSRKLPRSVRVALWNDVKFREFALRSIDWYLLQYPKYRFSVSHPRRLPRRRRP